MGYLRTFIRLDIRRICPSTRSSTGICVTCAIFSKHYINLDVVQLRINLRDDSFTAIRHRYSSSHFVPHSGVPLISTSTPYRRFRNPNSDNFRWSAVLHPESHRARNSNVTAAMIRNARSPTVSPSLAFIDDGNSRGLSAGYAGYRAISSAVTDIRARGCARVSAARAKGRSPSEDGSPFMHTRVSPFLLCSTATTSLPPRPCYVLADGLLRPYVLSSLFIPGEKLAPRRRRARQAPSFPHRRRAGRKRE